MSFDWGGFTGGIIGVYGAFRIAVWQTNPLKYQNAYSQATVLLIKLREIESKWSSSKNTILASLSFKSQQAVYDISNFKSETIGASYELTEIVTSFLSRKTYLDEKFDVHNNYLAQTKSIAEEYFKEFDDSIKQSIHECLEVRRSIEKKVKRAVTRKKKFFSIGNWIEKRQPLPYENEVSEAEKERKEWSLGKIISVIIIGYILGATVLFFVSDNWTDRGSFGDMFGSLNTLFSALAFAAVAYSTMLQRRDLEITRADFKIQIGEIQRQAEATAESAKQLEKQQLLLNFQMTQETVLALIKLKNGIYRENPLGDGMPVDKYTEYIERFSNVFFSILEFIQESELSDKQKDLLFMILRTHTKASEIGTLEAEWSRNQHRLILLQKVKK